MRVRKLEIARKTGVFFLARGRHDAEIKQVIGGLVRLNVSSGPPPIFARGAAFADWRKVSCRPTFPNPAGERRIGAKGWSTMTKIKD
jgi:hypothetical protein